MKKLLSMLLAAWLVCSLSACSSVGAADGGSFNEKGNAASDSQNTEYDPQLLATLEKAIDTVQPGTAGSSLKAIYAARDILDYLKENNPDFNTMAATVKYFFENTDCTEAKEAFKSIDSVFNILIEGEYAQQLLDSVEIKLSELDLSADVIECVDRLFDEIEKYIQQTD